MSEAKDERYHEWLLKLCTWVNNRWGLEAMSDEEVLNDD